MVFQLAAAAMRDMGAVPGKYLAIHWRDSEEGCYSETPEKHVGYDFCTGAGGLTLVPLTTSFLFCCYRTLPLVSIPLGQDS